MNQRASCRIAVTIVGLVTALVVGLATAGAWADDASDEFLTPEDLPPAWRAPLGVPARLVIDLHEDTFDIVISGDGRWLVAARISDTLLLGKLAGYWSFECMALATGVVLLLALWLLWRASRRARVVGEPHCRQCHYQLTGLRSSQCPECGVDLTRRRPVIGRSPWPLRVFTATIAVAALVALAFSAFNRTTLRLVVEEALADWHSRWVCTFRDEWPRGCVQWCGVLDIYDTATGRLDRSIEMGIEESPESMMPSRDGRYIFHTMDRWPLRLARHDLSNDAITVMHEQQPDGWGGSEVVGVTEDGQVYVMAGEHYLVDPTTGRVSVLPVADHNYIFSRCMRRRGMMVLDNDHNYHIHVQDGRTGARVADFHQNDFAPLAGDDYSYPPVLLLDVNAVYRWRNPLEDTDPQSVVERREYATKATKAVSVTIPRPSPALEGEDHSVIESVALPVADSRYVLVMQSHRLPHRLPQRYTPKRTVVGVWDLSAGKYVHRFDGPFAFGIKPLLIAHDGRTLVVTGQSPKAGSPIVAHLYDISRWAQPLAGRPVKAAERE